MSKADSRVPEEIQAYHAALRKASSSHDLIALGYLWQAFEYYLEPEPLKQAIQLLSPWPSLQQALQRLGSCLYPTQIQSAYVHPLVRNNLPEALQPWANWLFPTQKPRLSVCLIVRDEAHNLPYCLNSIESIADEIIILDTGSTDGTQAVAHTYPKVTLSEMLWPDDFSIARNQSLEKASGEWIMILDADERLLPESLDVLNVLLGHPPRGWQIYLSQVQHLLGKDHFYTWATRLFRRDPAIRFTGALHELPVKWSEPSWMLQVSVPFLLEHHGNLPDVYQSRNKPLRAAKIKALIENPPTATPYLMYHYAYLLVNGIDIESDFQLAEHLLWQALELSLPWQGKIPPDPGYLLASTPAVVMLLAQLYTYQQRHDALAELYLRFEQDCPLTPFPALAAASLQALGRLVEAKTAWLRCFDPGLIPIRQHENWKIQALEALLNIGLQQHDGFLAMWATRRLRERFPDGQLPDRHYNLATIQQQLEQLLELPSGTWLDRLEFELKQALTDKDTQAIAFYSFLYLCESWSQNVLKDALAALFKQGAQTLATALANFGADLYPEEKFFQIFGAYQPTYARLEPSQCSQPGGAYWLYLLQPPAVKPRVSLCMIVRNAADTLLTSLKASESLVDELVIADTGSVDSTREIIAEWSKTHTVKSLELNWRNDFSWARNQVLAQATGDWVLIIDADETLTPDSIPLLKQLFRHAPSGLQLFAIRCLNLYPNPQLNHEDWVPRIFPRTSLIRYWGALHNMPGHAHAPERLPLIPLKHVRVCHTGFSPDNVNRHNKADRLPILASLLKIQGLPNPYYLYHYAYALMYQYSPPDYQQAFELFEQSVSESERYSYRPPVPGWFPAPSRKVQVLMFRLLNHWQRDNELIKRYSIWQDRIDESEYHYWYATAALRQGQYSEAKAGFLRCLQAELSDMTEAGYGSWRALLGLTEVSAQTYNWPLGIEAFQALIANPGPLAAQQMFSNWWKRMSQTENKAFRRVDNSP